MKTYTGIYRHIVTGEKVSIPILANDMRQAEIKAWDWPYADDWHVFLYIQG